MKLTSSERSGQPPSVRVAHELPVALPSLLSVCPPLPDLYPLVYNFLISKNLVLFNLVSTAFVIHLPTHSTNIYGAPLTGKAESKVLEPHKYWYTFN